MLNFVFLMTVRHWVWLKGLLAPLRILWRVCCFILGSSADFVLSVARCNFVKFADCAVVLTVLSVAFLCPDVICSYAVLLLLFLC
jgi:hypothetical protein